MPQLRTARLDLFPASSADLDALWAIWREPEVRRYLFDDAPVSREHAGEVLESGMTAVGLGLWTVRIHGEASVIGCVGLLPMTTAAESNPGLTGAVGPIASFIPSVWGQGYASEALEAVITYGFDAFGLSKLAGVADAGNEASHRGAGTLSVERIEEASTMIDPVFRNSPQLAAEPLSRELGVELILKVETLNPVRSFKGRGADYFLHCLTGHTPLVTASAGNFGQGLAYAAAKRSLPLHVFAAGNANPLKVRRMRELGATVTLEGHDFDAAKAAARDYAGRQGWRFVEDGAEPAIAEGAGTIGLELLAATDRLNAFVVPVGNGAMINGIGTYVKARASGTRVIGVCAGEAPAMERSWRAGSAVSTPPACTIADGVAVRVPVPAAVEEMGRTTDDVVLVEEETILRAMRLVVEHTGLVVEPAGALGVAAVLADPGRFAGQRVATVLCGGNVTAEQMRTWLWR